MFSALAAAAILGAVASQTPRSGNHAPITTPVQSAYRANPNWNSLADRRRRVNSQSGGIALPTECVKEVRRKIKKGFELGFFPADATITRGVRRKTCREGRWLCRPQYLSQLPCKGTNARNTQTCVRMVECFRVR